MFVCSVADGKKCNGKKELYSNGYCYKVGEARILCSSKCLLQIVGGEINAEKSEGVCENDGAKLASVHSAAENHAIRTCTTGVSKKPNSWQ